MILSTSNFIQATVEIFAAVIIVILTIMFVNMTGKKTKSQNDLFWTMILGSLSLIADAGWRICDGGAGTAAFAFNWVFNVLTFLCNPLMIACGTAYIFFYISEDGHEPARPFTYAVQGLCLGAALLPISNIFIKWMWYIDDNNCYQRLTGWYIYAVLNALALVLLAISIIVQRRLLSKTKFIALILFLICPFVGIALQIRRWDFAFIQLGIVLAILILVGSYVYEWIRHEGERNAITEARRSFWIIEGIFLIVVLCISAAIVSSIINVKQVSEEESVADSTAPARMVSETVDNELSEPISVSRTMAQSGVILEALSQDDLSGTDCEADMLAFLQRIQQQYGYQQVYVACDSTKAFYTYEGYSRQLDLGEDGVDAWYSQFTADDIQYLLNIDADKDNNMSQCVFVNMGVWDQNGKFLGMCGVGMSLDSLLDLLGEYEDQYALDISLTDDTGMITVDTNRDRIKTDYMDLVELSKEDSDTILYNRTGSRAVLTKYMEGINWYLTVVDRRPDKVDVFRVVAPSIVIYAVGIILMLLFTLTFGLRERKLNNVLTRSIKISETDSLTGLYNRYAIDKHIADLQTADLSKDLAFVMIDVNGLKEVNDTLGHNAGDEIIRGAANCIAAAFSNCGSAFRTGGDEFVIICDCPAQELTDALSSLRGLLASWKGSYVQELSLSIGVAALRNNPDYSLFELEKEADRLMYADKEAYYQQSGRDRRRR